MGSEVEITHGGVVAVDTDDLRAMAGRILADAAAVQVARDELLEIPGLVEQAGLAPQIAVRGAAPVWPAANRLAAVGVELDALASAAATTADVFELADLRAQQAMLGAGDVARARDLRRRVEQLLASNAQLPALDERLRESWRQRVTEGFAPEHAALLSGESMLGASMAAVSPALVALTALLAWNTRAWTEGAKNLLTSVAAENGVVGPTPLAPRPTLVMMADSTPSPVRGIARPGDVVVTRGDPVSVPAGPATLSGAVSRVPYAQAPQVRVETYVMADGAKRFVAYIDGTRGQSAEEPWSMDSNVTAYAEHAESDSYKAVVEALNDAGAGEGAPVDLVGYSQGGMIAGLVAQSGEFDVHGVFTVGAPIEPVLPPDVLSVAVRHTDDPVAGLTGGGSPNGTGSPDSLVITRTVAPGHGIDPDLPAHQLDGYQETVRRAEASGDVRMAGIAEHFAPLDQATSVTSTDYTAKRVVGVG